MIISHCLTTMGIILFFLLALSLWASSVSAKVLFVSIDCGSSGIYVDTNFIVWMGDSNLTHNGKSRVVQINSSDHVMNTLRVFTTRKKNCYSIKVGNNGERVLVRASFYYGNYDGKNSPPTFDLQFDGNNWATVETSDTVIYYEVIYVVKADVVSVCVAQTKPDQFPFMSALEVRGLDSTMYSQVDAEYALNLWNNRLAYGSNATVRYPDDPYDRFWSPAPAGNGLLNVKTQAASITVNVEENPPQSVLENAITAINTSEYIVLIPSFATIPIQIYFTMYFSEVTQHNSTQNRSFVVEINQTISDPIVPPFGSVFELYGYNFTAYPDTLFYLKPTTNSTLPPLINAMELLQIIGPLTNGTDANDVVGLASLQSAFDVLQGWGGDPCLPEPYSWEWINCTSDTPPRVTALYLGSFGLSGLLPNFSSMTALEKIDMHNNSISGPIPNFLGTLPNLIELNLADNKLNGSIPTSLSNNNKVKLNVTGNPNLCTSMQCPVSSGTTIAYGRSKKKSTLPVILEAMFQLIVLFLGALWVL